ncbi:MAG TPA: hypothetical protein PKD67_05280 [Ignavibacteriaceae bacterium]|nr:hypothetical protein [Ignavibacteriaceae bacterium]
MTDEQKIFGLIPAKALGCLDTEDNVTIQSYIEQGFDFPWDELGKYQYIASLLPLALQLEIPEPQIKDNVALRLIKLSEELRAKQIKEEEEAIALNKIEEPIDNFTDDNINPEELVEKQAPVDNDELLATFNLDDITLPEADSPEPFTLTEADEQKSEIYQLTSEESLTENLAGEETETIPETTANEDYISSENVEVIAQDNIPEGGFAFSQTSEEEIEEEKIEKEEKSIIQQIESPAIDDKPDDVPKYAKLQETKKKLFDEKMFKALEQDFDTLKSNLAENEKRFTRNILMAYVAIAVLLALLIFSFFKFSSDVKSLENQIKDLKKRQSSELIFPTKINSDFFFHS